MASSSSSTTTESSAYDLFLNFRGEDTRYAFVSFLHRTLKERGINVFLDSKNLWTGESIGPTLLAAINGSKISIPILSERYAYSRWCLIELAQIVECHKSNSQLVLPIFFKVDPSNVRNQEGSFAEAFQEHEKNNFEPQTIECWRDALKVVGNLKGEVVDDTTDQAKVVDFVVKRVLGELDCNTHLNVCKHPIGIETPVNDLLSLLDFDSNDVLLVGIWGFGGIGKTTIAKAVYNCIISTFSKHSFISDIREQAMQNMGLVSLQQRLLKDIFKLDNIDIPNHHAGIRLIQERLCKQKVFIVLDDVDSKEQVDALIGETNWFGQGSRVIMTTRDEEILNKAKVRKIYKPQELTHDQSLQLFSLHAFASELPPDDRMQLSNDVVSYSGGLPLTLEVLGSLLSDRTSAEDWESTLQYLKETPHKDVQKRLRISFDKLDDDQKEIFLDAACLFIGKGKEVVTSIWKACGYEPRFPISILIKRSLIKFEDDRGYLVLKMHDQIRDMGRRIVREENHRDPSKRSRLWSHHDILQALESNEGTSMVKSMVIPAGMSFVCLHQKHFDMMSNLEFLQIYSDIIIENFWSLPSKLKWFRWIFCSWDTVPTNFCHNGLVHLQLSGYRIKQAWDTTPRDDNKRFQKLKVLVLHGENLAKSPNFSWFPYLEQLDLSCCRKLENLDESIGQLNQLKSLNLEGCHQITELPDSIGHLKSLVELDLSYTQIKEFPYNISKLSSLKNLKIDDYSSKLPDFIGDLKNLVELRLNRSINSEHIYEVPDSIELLENLQVLSIPWPSSLLKLPRSMGKMKCLHTLNLHGANISEFPDDFSMLSNLEELGMTWKLKSFPVDLSHFKKLRILTLVRCTLLEELPEVLSSLVELKCIRCSSLVRTFDISRLTRLKVLHFSWCFKLKEIQGLERTESLDYFVFTRCGNMTDGKSNINGQGKLLLPASTSQGIKDYRLCADSKGLILCIIFRFVDEKRIKEGWPASVDLHISSTIHQKNKATKCKHTLRFTGLESTSRRDMICLHHFKGFDWFGIPLQGKDSIVIQEMKLLERLSHARLRLEVKFMKLIFQGREPEPQEPIDPALMVADFFSWYDGPSKIKEEELGSVSEVVGAEEEEEEEMSWPSKRRRVLLHADDDQV